MEYRQTGQANIPLYQLQNNMYGREKLAQNAPNGRGKDFYPNVDRDEAVTSQTRSFLNRVYRGSVGLMMSAMAEKQELSREEIDELYAILKEAEVRQK